MSIAEASLTLTLEGAIGILTLTRKAKRNALDMAMLEAWPCLLDRAADDDRVRVLIVTGGTGVAFSAGADIDEMRAFATDPVARDRFCQSFAMAQSAMADFPKPSIAMISGPCVGGGCGLALGCDIRIADRTATLGVTPAKLGLGYSIADTKRLVDAVGFAQAADLLFSGRLVDAEQARAIDLVSRVVDAAVLEPETRQLARMIAANAPSSQQAIKASLKAIKAGQTADDDVSRRAFAEAFLGEDFAERLVAFLDRRTPGPG
jgi:enoyl-CoA hydratase/carnithine racemase